MANLTENPSRIVPFAARRGPVLAERISFPRSLVEGLHSCNPVDLAIRGAGVIGLGLVAIAMVTQPAGLFLVPALAGLAAGLGLLADYNAEK